MTEFYVVLAYIVPICICAVFIAKFAVFRPKNADKFDKKLQSSREKFIDDLEDQLDSAKHELSSRERGPRIKGEASEWESLLPELVGSFETFLPKWFKPFARNKEIQSALIEKIKADPEKYAGYIGKLIGKKPTTDDKSGIAPEDAL